MQQEPAPQQLTAAENKPIECYSISVNRQGTKLASGGLDGKVKVWDVQSIVSSTEALQDQQSLVQRMEQPQCLQRPLASMSRHNGVVTSVKFSPDGKYLASGSDDKIVLIWEKDDDQAARPRLFGETDADVEHWMVRKRLVAHDNDVQDICWSPDGALLITVGLDRSIIIWSGVTFERIKRYDIHQSMVKGIVFDPANKFFATASDDRTVRIFRYYKKMNEGASGAYEFQMEQVVMDPFQKSPLTSYFRRMSWSPDGQHIAVPNATNGPVSSVVIINRGHWATDVSLIGHEAPCEVCSFSPRMYQLDGNEKDSGGSATVIATGGQDRTLAIWSTALTKPLLVARDMVARSITDLAWTPDGTTLFVSSLDGSITCLLFGENELGVLVSDDVIGLQLVKYGGDRDSTVMPESVDMLNLEALAASQTLPSVVPLLNKLDSDIVSDYKVTATAKQYSPSGTGSCATLEENAPDKSTSQQATTDGAMNAVTHSLSTATSNIPGSEIASLDAATSDKAADKAILDKAKSGLKAVADASASKELVHGSSQVTASPKLTKRSQSVTLTKGGRKRVMPTLVSGFSERKAPTTKTPGLSKRLQSSKISQTPYILPRLGVQSAVGGLRPRQQGDKSIEKPTEDLDNDNEDMGINDSGTQRTSSGASMRSKAKKYRKLVLDRNYPTPFKMVSDLPEALFSNQTVINHELKHLLQKNELFGSNNDLVTTSSLDAVDECLFFRVIVKSVKHSPKTRDEGSNGNGLHAGGATETVLSLIEVRNGPAWPDYEDGASDFAQRVDFRDPTQVLVTNDGQADTKSYILYFPYKIQQVIPILIDNALEFYVLISFDGLTQFVWAETGTYAAPPMELGSNVVVTRQKGSYFLLLTSAGLVYCWRMPNAAKLEFKIEAVVKGVSVAPAINSEVEVPKMPDSAKKPPHVFVDNIKRVEVDLHGTPYVVLERTNSVFAYSLDLMVWTKVLDPWYFNALDQTDIDVMNQQTMQGRLLRITFRDKQEQIQRRQVPRYIWEENLELQRTMKARFQELIK